MKIGYDVIIVGAGPAGASCANELVKKNINTLLIERYKNPTVKSLQTNLTTKPENIMIYNLRKFV